jgi:phosphoribosylamine---glycine ligase
MKILIIGSGGREHALAWQVAQASEVTDVFIAPGNPGMAYDAKLQLVDIDIRDFAALAEFAQDNAVTITIVGPEAPLVAGIVDYFSACDLKCFGPNQYCAQLEGSKIFAKEFLQENNIPTAGYKEFSDYASAWEYTQKCELPLVIKADGLAAGKGVFIVNNLEEAQSALRSILTDKQFGAAGNKLIIEDFIRGEEASFMIVTDGTNYKCLANSQDHKHLNNGDTGVNTGGMGAYSPTTLITAQLEQEIIATIVEPTLAGIRKQNNAFTGFLYFGLMINQQGQPFVLEYNVRLGDPETQVIMLRLQSNLASLCLACLDGTLAQQELLWDTKTAVGVVMAAAGYPGTYQKGDAINCDLEDRDKNTKVFFAGVSTDNSTLITSGGRVLCVTAKAADIHQAQQLAYTCIDKVSFNGNYYREDIAFKELQR